MFRLRPITGRSPGALLALAAGLTLACAGPGAAQESEDEPEGFEPERSAARLNDVGNEGTGVFHLNQAAADAVNQDNVLVAALVEGTGAAFADGATTQANAGLDLAFAGGDANIAGTANEARGIVGINQSAASGSSQGNLVGLALTRGEDGLAVASLAATARAQPQARAEGAFAAGPAGASSVSLSDSGNAASGILQANQAAGAGAAQANIAAIAVAENGFALADALADVPAGGGEGHGDLPVPAGSAAITGSFNGASGLVQLNQAAGSGNAQTNLFAAAFGTHASASAIPEAGLGEMRPVPAGDAQAQDEEAGAQLSIADSFAGFTGVAQVSQVVGHGNQTANTVSVSVSRGPGL